MFLLVALRTYQLQVAAPRDQLWVLAHGLHMVNLHFLNGKRSATFTTLAVKQTVQAFLSPFENPTALPAKFILLVTPLHAVARNIDIYD